MTAAWQQPGRTDSAAYATDDAGQSPADEQRLEAIARELATDAFMSQTVEARNWLRDVLDGEGSFEATIARDAILFAAIYESPVDLTLAVDRLRACYVDERNEDYDADAAESLAADDADSAADFEGDAA